MDCPPEYAGRAAQMLSNHDIPVSCPRSLIWSLHAPSLYSEQGQENYADEILQKAHYYRSDKESVKKSEVKLPEFGTLGTTMGLPFAKLLGKSIA
jgi:hypothetical protein